MPGTWPQASQRPVGTGGSGFTLLIEQAVMLLARDMQVNVVARYVGVTDKRYGEW